MSCKVKY